MFFVSQNQRHTWRSVIFLRLLLRIAIKLTLKVGRLNHMSFQNCHIAAIGEKKSLGVSTSIGRFSLAIKFAAVGV